MARILCVFTTWPKWRRWRESRIVSSIRNIGQRTKCWRNLRAGCQRNDSFDIIRLVIEVRKLRADISEKEGHVMPRHIILVPLLLAFLFASLPSLQAQLPPEKKDPLSPAQSAAGKAGCSTTEASSCAEAAAKILPVVMGSSPLEENLRRLTDEIGGRVTGTSEMAKAVEWGVGAFRAAGVDVHTEKYTLPVTWSEGETRLNPTEPISALVKEAVRDGKIFTIMPGLRAVSEAWGPPTPKNGITAKIVDVGDGSEEEFARAGAT